MSGSDIEGKSRVNPTHAELKEELAKEKAKSKKLRAAYKRKMVALDAFRHDFTLVTQAEIRKEQEEGREALHMALTNERTRAETQAQLIRKQAELLRDSDTRIGELMNQLALHRTALSHYEKEPREAGTLLVYDRKKVETQLGIKK